MTLVCQSCRVLTLGLACMLAATAGFAQDQFFDSDGVKIRYVVEGEGEPLVLIHGYTASYETNWKMPGVATKLAQHYKVIGIDCRGHGKSDKPHDAAAYGAKMSADVKNLLDHLNIPKAHIAGYSMGGMITLHFINTYPERCLSGIVGGMGWSEEPVGGPDFAETLAKSLESGQGIAPLIAALTPAGQPAPSEEEMKMMNQMLLAINDAKALAAVARGFSGLTLTKAQVQANKVPAIGIIGEIDPLKVAADSMKANLGSIVDVVVIPGADHMTAFGNTMMAEAMLKFLKAHPQEGEGGAKLKDAA